MNKLKTLLSFIALTTSSLAFADSGKAILNHFVTATWNIQQPNQVESYIYISNIASQAVNVEVTFYDQTGNIISDTDNNATTGLLKASNVTGYTDNATTYSEQFVLASNASTKVWIDHNWNNEMIGYAIIEWWKSTSTTGPKISNALVAHAVVYRSNGSNVGYYDVAINNGQSF